ncbi:MAG: GxxExxY protein [candidate division WOR-3 bacterium]|jgi:GxxExxY protein|nr:GxxExxY protein [candidate division WOR-3 bacterium]MDH7519452.1 GxxExxY protein [bacterium]
MTSKNDINESIKQAAEEVLEILGPGYKENVYEEAFAHELRIRKIPYERQRNFEILYKGYRVSDGRADLIINPLWAKTSDKETVLELKAVKKITESHRRQAQVYMVSLNIDQGAVLSFGDEVLLEPVAKPDRTLNITVADPREKPSTAELMNTLRSAAEEVFDYFGREFIYREDTEKLFPAAIGVELRLRGVAFTRTNYDLLYKCHKVYEYEFEFAFPDGAVATVVTYEDDEDIEEEKEEFSFYVKEFGLKKGYLIAIPAAEEGKVKVEEV